MQFRGVVLFFSCCSNYSRLDEEESLINLQQHITNIAMLHSTCTIVGISPGGCRLLGNAVGENLNNHINMTRFIC